MSKISTTIKKGLIVKSILSSELNSHCQVNLIDMQTQSDGNYKFIMWSIKNNSRSPYEVRNS